jgi:hypothetical protein
LTKAFCFTPVAALAGKTALIPVSRFVFTPVTVEADVVAAEGANVSRHAATITILAARLNPVPALDPTTKG